MTKTQIKYLKMLGYNDTQEDGAVLRNRRLRPADQFVWTAESFEDVMSVYSERLDRSVRCNVADSIYMSSVT